MTLFKSRTLFPVCILCSCFLFAQKSFAFDYQKYSKERKQIRSLTPTDRIAAEIPKSTPKKKRSDKAFAHFTQTLLEAMDTDIPLATLFDSGNGLSLYFKPSKVTKVGFRYKF